MCDVTQPPQTRRLYSTLRTIMLCFCYFTPRRCNHWLGSVVCEGGFRGRIQANRTYTRASVSQKKICLNYFWSASSKWMKKTTTALIAQPPQLASLNSRLCNQQTVMQSADASCPSYSYYMLGSCWLELQSKKIPGSAPGMHNPSCC